MLTLIAAVAVILFVVQVQIDLLVAPESTKLVKIIALVVAIVATVMLIV